MCLKHKNLVDGAVTPSSLAPKPSFQFGEATQRQIVS